MDNRLFWLVIGGVMMNEWNNIDSEEDIDSLMKIYDNFEDCFIVKFEFVSGNYIDDNLTAHEFDTNNLLVLFQRQDKNPYSIEIMFEMTKKINFYAPVQGDEDYNLADILYAKIVKDDRYFYWTMWKEFNPFNAEHLNYNDFTLIQSRKVKWRIVS